MQQCRPVSSRAPDPGSVRGSVGAARGAGFRLPFDFLGRKSARYSIRGTLRDAATNRNVGGVKVDLRQLGGVTVATVFTDVSGDFTFDGLGSGQYDIAVNEAGYEPIDQQVSVQDSVFGLQIWLRKPNGAHGESAGPTISVRELSIPPKAHELMQKGLLLLSAKSDYRGSITQFERAIKEYPAYYEAYAEMGVAYMELGDVASSEQALRKSIDVSQQRYADAYFLLADLYFERQALCRRRAGGPQGRRRSRATPGRVITNWPARSTDSTATRRPKQKLRPPHSFSPTGRKRACCWRTSISNCTNIRPCSKTWTPTSNSTPNGAHADQARQLREQVQTALEKAQAAAESDDNSAEDDEPDSK